MPSTGPSKSDPTGLRRQLARENAAADMMARASDKRRAKKLLGRAVRARDSLPQYIPSKCPQCGAVTVEDANGICKQVQTIFGDYECATTNMPDTDGLLHQINPAWNAYDEYVWHLRAFINGSRNSLPAWPQI